MDTGQARKYEFPLLVLILCGLAWLLLNALQDMREQYEVAAMQVEASVLRNELLDRLAHHQSVGGGLPDSRNPVVWAAYKPENYLGELDNAPAEGNVWYFDTRRQELAYRYRSGREARFRLVGGAAAAGAQGVLGGIGLLRVDVPEVAR
ncbi:hypothetical protein FACS1894158_16450 [Betaproteobacteria bacterium]|nr:hypothetical protein FACS1894158_16450 [Betaproteobacteria bacterium]